MPFLLLRIGLSGAHYRRAAAVAQAAHPFAVIPRFVIPGRASSREPGIHTPCASVERKVRFRDQ
jgi:hypothetical protein